MPTRAGATEWPLAFFTVFAQAAVGTSLAREGFAFTARGRAPAEEIEVLTGPALVIACGLLLAALLAAVPHLGRLGSARFALRNLRTSWLSRELALTLFFGATLAAQLATRRFAEGPPEGPGILGFAAPVIGLALVYAISRVYMIRTVPAWNTWATPTAFLGTTLLLGAGLFASALVITANRAGAGSDLVDRSFLALALAAAVLAVLQALLASLHFDRFAAPDGEDGPPAAAAARREHRIALALRAVCGPLGAAILLVVALRGYAREREVALPLACACVLLLASELLGRFLFYTTHRRLGL